MSRRGSTAIGPKAHSQRVFGRARSRMSLFRPPGYSSAIHEFLFVPLITTEAIAAVRHYGQLQLRTMGNKYPSAFNKPGTPYAEFAQIDGPKCRVVRRASRDR